MRYATLKLSLLVCAMSFATQGAYAAGVTGNIGVYSKYILRGMTNSPEQDAPAVQGGLDYVNDNGFYAGYWFSSLGYSYKNLDGVSSTHNSVENDFYAGYNGKAGDFGYTLGGTVYYYMPGWNSTAFESKLGISYKDFSLTAQTLFNDVTYGNKGDTYFLGTYSTKLPKDFMFTGQVGLYRYTKDGDYVPQTADSVSYGFRHLTLGVTHPLGNTGGTMGLSFIVGGKDRYAVKQKNQIVASVGFSF